MFIFLMYVLVILSTFIIFFGAYNFKKAKRLIYIIVIEIGIACLISVADMSLKLFPIDLTYKENKIKGNGIVTEVNENFIEIDKDYKIFCNGSEYKEGDKIKYIIETGKTGNYTHIYEIGD